MTIDTPVPSNPPGPDVGLTPEQILVAKQAADVADRRELLRAWRPTEVPEGASVRVRKLFSKGLQDQVNAKVYPIDEAMVRVERPLIGLPGQFETLRVSLADLLDEYEYVRDKDEHETWRPCGKPIDPMPAGKKLPNLFKYRHCGVCERNECAVGDTDIQVGKERRPVACCGTCRTFLGNRQEWPTIAEAVCACYSAAHRLSNQFYDRYYLITNIRPSSAERT